MLGRKRDSKRAGPAVAGPLLRRQLLARCVWLLALVLLAILPPHLAAAGPKALAPSLKIPLEPIGFLTPAPRVLAAGGPLFTLHYVDDTHLLFTYYTRGLLPRLADSTPEDNDGLVAGVLLDLPSGKVLARTQWRMRDRDPYLWPVGHGRFLLRVRSRLMLLSPMQNLPSGDAFREEPFGNFSRRIGFISISPGGDLLVVQTVPPPKPKLTGGPASAAALAATQSATRATATMEPKTPEVQINFFRMALEKRAGEPERLVRRSAGALLSANLILVPANADGFLSISKESRGVYLFDFQTHNGKRVELSPYETTCAPHPIFVSRSEFIAFGCHGAQGKPEIGGFNLKGEHAWIEVLPGDHLSPHIVAAPAAGRFAMSRTLVQGGLIDPQNYVPQELATQEITVRQNHDGRLLLKIMADPVQRPPQNFDLAPDGLSLAVIRLGNIEIYRLPALTGKDESALKLAAAMEPEKNDAKVQLDSKPVPTLDRSAGVLVGAAPATGTESARESETHSGHESAPSVAPGSAPSRKARENPDPTPSGDAPAERRKPPTLYDADHPREAEQGVHSKPPAPQ